MEVLFNKQKHKVPIKYWGEMPEFAALDQLDNAAALPFIFHHIAAMPDHHAGKGIVVGGVMATECALIPESIGPDIGCGMNARRTNIEAGKLRALHPGGGTTVKRALGAIQRNVPTGNGPGGSRKDAVYIQGNPKAQGFWFSYSDIQDKYGSAGGFPKELKKATDESLSQIGTLGGGNHFLELNEDEEGFVWIVLHSGSRGLGKKVFDFYQAEAVKLNNMFHSEIKARGFAFLPTDHPSGQHYLAWMKACMEWALLNRTYMLDAAIEALFSTVKGVAPDDKFLVTEAIDTHHNFIATEHHFGKNVQVHRKGAVRARTGELLIIPGSMETGTYIGKGLGNPEAFESAPHGAGRRLSRKAAREARTPEEMMRIMKELGVELATRDTSSVVDESGHAYKDLSAVIEASSDLVEPLYHLKPLGVLKG